MKIRDAEVNFDVRFRYDWNGYDAYDGITLIEDFPSDYISENKLLVVANIMKHSKDFLDDFNSLNNTNITLDSDIYELNDYVGHVVCKCEECVYAEYGNELKVLIYTANGTMNEEAWFEGKIKNKDIMFYTVTDIRV